MKTEQKTGMAGKKTAHGLVPRLRFPEFRSAGGWKKKKLGELAKRITRKNKDIDVARVLTNSAIDGIVDQRDYFDKDIANKSNLAGYYIVEEGDYIYNPRISSSAPVGPIGKNKIATGIMSPLYSIFQFKKNQNDFFEQYFQTTCWHHYIRRVGSSGARHDRMSISVTDFMNMPILEPYPEEQQKIADCLSSVDELITAQAKKLDTLKAHKKGLMQQLFPAKGETVPKLRFPEFQDAGAWEEESIQELIDKKNIISHLDGNHGALYPRAEEFSQEGVPYISANDFITGFVDFRGCKHLPMERALKFKKGVAVDGDILFAHNATVGPVAKLITSLQFVILSTTATYFRCDNKKLISDFFKFALSCPSFIEQYTRVMSQSTRNQVPITAQRKFRIKFPRNHSA